MKNFVNYSFILHLQRINSPFYDKITVQIANQLMQQISHTTCIHRLIELFSGHLEDQRACHLHIKISEWKNYLQKTVTSHQEALAKLSQIESTDENKSLIILLQEIMNHPGLLLHDKIPSLLEVLRNERLAELIEYTVTLPTAPKPLTVRKGSFFEQKTTSKQQEDCITLLQNLAAVIDQKCPLWNAANTLLQSALLIYPALTKIEAEAGLDELQSLITQRSPFAYNEQKDAWSCVIF